MDGRRSAAVSVATRDRSLKTVVDKLYDEAQFAGLTLLGPGRDRAYRRYRFHACGHEQELATSAVRRSRLRCKSCLDQQQLAAAAAAGLELVGPGRNANYRRYRFALCGHEQEVQVTHARAGSVRCRQCGTQKQSIEAASGGLELIGSGTSAHTRIYRFSVCGHAQELHISAVRDGRIRCQTCLDLRLTDEASAAGLDLVGEATTSDSRLYRFRACGHQAVLQASNVRRGGAPCPKCKGTHLHREAAREGLVIVGPGRNAQYRIYRFQSCGHEREFTMNAVRRHHIRCEICFQHKLQGEAAEEGLTVIGVGDRSDYRIYRFDACGHRREMAPGAVRRGHVRCKVCLEAGLSSEAAANGLELLGPGQNANYRRYRFLDCGHERDLGPSQVRRGVAFCRVCFEATLIEQARASGVEILGRGRTTGYRRYRFILCGHEQDMQPVHVRLEGFHCQLCNESAWNGTGNVYVIALTRGDQRIYKVGLAKSVVGRATRYGLKPGVDIEICFTTTFEKYRTAHAVEQRLHAEFRALAVQADDARRYLTSGFTECYSNVPIEVLSDTIARMRRG